MNDLSHLQNLLLPVNQELKVNNFKQINLLMESLTKKVISEAKAKT